MTTAMAREEEKGGVDRLSMVCVVVCVCFFVCEKNTKNKAESKIVNVP